MAKISDLSGYGSETGLIDRLRELYGLVGAVADTMDFVGDTGSGSVAFNSQVLDFEGVPNQVITSAAGSTITFGTPQDIHPSASPTFAGATIGSGTGLVLSTAGVLSTVIDNRSNWDAAYTHISNNGSDHSYINQDVKNSASPMWAGVNISAAGDLRLYNAGNTYYTGFKAPTLLASQIYTMPLTDGAAGEALVTSGGGAGVLSWAAAGGSPGGSPSHVQYNNAGAFGGNASFTYDGAGTVYAATAYNTSSAGEYQINGTKMLAGAASVLECGHTIDSGSSTIFTAVGSNIGTASLAGTRNVFVGDLIASRTVAAASGTDNILIGYTMAHSTTALQSAASYNTIIGSYGGFYLTTAASNTGVGYKVMETLATGTNNSCFGFQAGKGICAATGNCLFGYNTGSAGDSDYRTLFGYNLTVSGAQNTIMGTSIGVTTGTGNTIMGGQVSVGTNPSNAALFGYYAANKAFDYMCAFGGNAGSNYNSSKVGSCFFGYSSGNALAGTNMVLMGRESGGWSSNRITNNVILIGAYSGFYNATADTFIVDCFKRADAATEKVSSVLHCDMHTTVASQYARINANTTIRHSLSCVPEQITATSAGVAASLTTVGTDITTNGDSDLDNVTVPDGSDGQRKTFKCIGVGNAADTLKITPTNLLGGTQITFPANPIGLGCEMEFSSSGGGWVIIGNNGGTVT